MKAILTTRCGCTKILSVNSPPKSRLEIALKTSPLYCSPCDVTDISPLPTSLEIRVFELTGIVPGERLYEKIALYEEAE